MSTHTEGWAQLKHGGLLISPARLDEYFPASADPMSGWEAEQLRRAVTAFDGSRESFTRLLDYVLEHLTGLPAAQWQKAQQVEQRWSVASFTGARIRPRRIWQGLQGASLAVFVPEQLTGSRASARLGVGRSRKLLSRVVEWLRHTGQPLALVTNGRQWRLVHAGPDHDAWCEWDTDLWFDEGQPSAQTLIWRTLLNPHTLQAEAGRPPLLAAIADSRKGQTELSAVLGERVRQAVEELITASHAVITRAQGQGTSQDYKHLYIAASRIVMRCIIVLFAEARGLLPVDNPIYQQAYSLEGLRHQLDRRASSRGRERLTAARSAWPRLLALFRLIHGGSGHEQLTVPRYGGTLFAAGDAASADGISRALALLEHPDNTISDLQVHKLLSLLTRTRMKVRQGRANRWVSAPVDFSALSSEYIGILYEGLLDFELKQAEGDDPVLFLGVGNQPALALSQLEAMDDQAVKQLFEKLRKDQKSSGPSMDDDAAEDDGDGDSDDEADELEDPDDQAEDAESDDTPDDDEDTDVEDEEDDSDAPTLSEDHRLRANAWLEQAAQAAKLVKRPRQGQTWSADEQHQALQKAARQLCVRLVAPGEFYLVRWGGTRKGAGTFYTRPQLVAPTVRRTLQPLAFEPRRTEVDPRTGLDTVVEWAPRHPEDILAIKVCDPAMGSASFLAGALRFLTDALVQSLYYHGLVERREDGGVPRLADGRITQRLTDELTRLEPDEAGFEPALRAQLKRHVVENCIYGVDIDQLAVELGRLSLWVETMDRDLPFGFLDHKLKVGDALVGAWFDTFRHYPAMAWEREGGDKDYQKNKPDNLINHHYTTSKGKRKGDVFTDRIKALRKDVHKQLIAQLNGQMELGAAVDTSAAHEQLRQVLARMHALPVHEADQQAELYRSQLLGSADYQALKARMDLWCALWFWPGEALDTAPLPRNFAQPAEAALATAAEVARSHRFFHWELEFPDVFTPERSGFDAVLGNPPWETIQPNSKEFFSNHDPLYRAYGKQEALAHQLDYFRARPQLEHDWIAYMAKLKALANWTKFVADPFGDRVITDNEGRQHHEVKLGSRGKNAFKESERLHAKWRLQRQQTKGFAESPHPYRYQGKGKPYTHKLFLELSHALTRAQGRFAMLVPSGIYTDKGSTPLRELFLEHCDWQWLFGFENRAKIFDIDSRFKFCPVVLQKGGQTTAIRTAFMHRDVDDWERADEHVLAYPRERVEQFSPWSKAILEIRSPRDLEVLQKIYANGVLLGDTSDDGWGIRYQQGDFNMTSDSRLFPPRPKWEARGYQPDEYGHWLKGGWADYGGPQHILDRPPDLVLSRDGRQAIRVDDIEDVALPLYEGRMIGQFDFSEKGWVSGKGRSAVWRDIPFDEKVIEPQYLMSHKNYITAVNRSGDPKAVRGIKPCFMDVSSATNKRTMIASVVWDAPCGNKVPVLKPRDSYENSAKLIACLNSFVFDYAIRNRLGGLTINYFIAEESPLPEPNMVSSLLAKNALNLLTCNAPLFSVLRQQANDKSETSALTDHERARLRAINDAVFFYIFRLNWCDAHHIMDECDEPLTITASSNSRKLNPKGFWRVDKDKDPELRHTVLSLVAFHDLQKKGLGAFLSQNNGEGWMIPETLRLADYGLGHDDRAREYQPVAERLGPRFYDWQLGEDVERSWEECAAHAALIRRIVPLPDADEDEAESAATAAANKKSQGVLF